MRTGALYKIDFNNGKSYIGITIGTLRRRMHGHTYCARRGDKQALYEAMRKYGEKSYRAFPLMFANDWEYLCEMERRAILVFCTKAPHGYNLTDGGDGVAGRPHTQEEREAVSKRHKGRIISAETRARQSAAMSNRTLTEEHKQKLREAKAGKTRKPPSAETRAKISAANKGRPLSAEHRRKLKESKRRYLSGGEVQLELMDVHTTN